MESLSVKYRPKTFEEMTGQSSIIKILSQQIKLTTFKNSYLFCGPSGCGKTTMARAFASRINNGAGKPIEIDAASNSGVENIRNVIANAAQRSLDSVYKIIILDECHSLTNQSWQALLKTIEEPPKYTIFIFCTTDPQKIPDTIINRCMKFNFGRFKPEEIYKRLCFICNNEHFINYEGSCDYISKICKGQMRDAISLLEKSSDFSTDLKVENTLQALGNYSFDSFFTLFDSLVDGNVAGVLNSIEYYYNQGLDLRLFVDQFITFLLDLEKYILFNSFKILTIPEAMADKINHSVRFDNNLKYIDHYLEKMMELKLLLNGDTNEKSTLTVVMLDCANWYIKENN